MRKNVWLRLGGATMLAAFALLAGYAAPASAQDAPSASRVVLPGKGKPGSPFNLASSSTYLLNHNAWVCGLAQVGNVCSSAVGSSVGGGGFWPQGTANQYIFNSGLQVAAVIGADGGAAANDTLATFFFHASGPGATSITPFWQTVGDGSGCRATTCAPGYIFASDRQIDLDNWPEECYIDNPVFGRVKTLSELDTCVQYWDGDPTASHFTDSHPMGLLVTQHSLVWSFPNNRDIMFYIYKFKNVSNTEEFRRFNPGTPAGGWTLTNVYAAFAADPDVSGSEYAENYATVVPELNLGTTWQYDFEAADFVPYAPNFDAAVGFFGVKFLKSPVNTSDTTMTIRVGSEVRQVAPGEELGLTFFSIFTNGGIMSDAGTGQQGFRYLSGKLLPTEQSQWCVGAPPGMCYVNIQNPADMRFYQSSGPFELAPGEEAEIVVAYLAGAPVPGTYTKGQVIPVGQVTDTSRAVERVMGRGYNVPGFPSLFANARTAQAIFDADFVLPAAPTGPIVTVIPGNKQNTVVWDASVINREDPFCQLAGNPASPLFDPNFRCNDFEGFRVYRKSNPAAPWTPIAQFDLANGIVEQITVLSSVVPEGGGDPIVVSADTAHVCPSETAEQLGLSAAFAGCAADTGLQFAIVDRGGSFPDPSNGPGLINGLRYYYTVTAFDINSPQSGPSTLESAKVLSQNASGIPRVTAAGIIPASVTQPALFGGDTQLDPTGETAIDPVDGSFEGPQPPTNGLRIAFQVFDPQLLAPGDFSVTIDSVVAFNGFESVLGTHTQDNPGACLAPVSAGYFFSINVPGQPVQHRKVEYPYPFGLFAGCDDHFESEVINVAILADTAAARAAGRTGSHFAGALTATLENDIGADLSGTAAVSVLRTGHSLPAHRSRWFVGEEPPRDPDDNLEAGVLAGVDSIINMSHQYAQNANLRWLIYINSPYMRAADMEVTWGANGEITGVRDLTHDVDVPFSDHYGATWGVRNESSGDGILSIGDFWLVTPTAEWFCETPGCHVPLERTAQIGPLSTVPPGGFGTDVATSNGNGFGLYIAGEMFLFKTNQVPAAGSKWILRTHHGVIGEDDAGGFEFESAVRQPAIPGLVAKVTVESPTAFAEDSVLLDRIHTVPDPYYVTNKLENTSAEKRMQFVNLPPQAVIRIYSLSGVLLNVLEHNDLSGGGTFEWDMRTRNNQFIASGVYFFHVEAPNGKTKVGKFTVVQFAQ